MPRPKKRDMTRFNLWLTDLQLDILWEESEKTGVPVSGLIRSAVNKWIEARESSRRYMDKFRKGE